jgi:peptidase inhibitor family I36
MNPRSRLLSNRSRLRRLVVAAALAPVLILTVSSAAQAATPADGGPWSSSTAVTLPSCPSHTLCTFKDADFKGTRWNFDYNTRPHAEWFWIGNDANDDITSFYNHRAWTSYFAKNCPADSQWQPSAGTGFVENLNDGLHFWPNGTNANDSISAIGFGTTTSTTQRMAHGSC